MKIKWREIGTWALRLVGLVADVKASKDADKEKDKQ